MGYSDISWKIILYRRAGSKASQKNYQKFCPATIWLKAGVGGSWSSLNSADESSLQGNDQPSRPLSSHSQLFWSHSQLFFCIPEESKCRFLVLINFEPGSLLRKSQWTKNRLQLVPKTCAATQLGKSPASKVFLDLKCYFFFVRTLCNWEILWKIVEYLEILWRNCKKFSL